MAASSGNRIIAWLSGALTLAVAIFSFVLSFNGLVHLAQQNHISIAPLFPLIVEFSVVVFSLNVLWRSLNSESAKVGWTLIITSSLLAGTFNIVNVAQYGHLAMVMHAMPSLFLLLSFETFLSQVRISVQRGGVRCSLAELKATLATQQAELVKMESTISASAEKLESIQADIKTARGELRQAKRDAGQLSSTELGTENLKQVNSRRRRTKEQKKTELAELVQLDPDVSVSEAARLLDIARQTVRTYADEIGVAIGAASGQNGKVN